MNPAQQYLIAINRDPDEAAQIASETAKKLETKELTLLDLTKSLGEFLTDDDRTIRAKAIGFYSSVLTALPPASLPQAQVSVITQFLCDRIEDEAGLKEAAQGILAVQKMTRFQSADAQLVAKTLFTAVDLPKHPQTTRFVVLQIVDKLMASKREAMKKLGSTYVRGLIGLVAGEKDPRNLMMVFSNLKVVIVEFDIVQHAESLVEAVFCYFPITFRPPPDDPYGITSQDLKNRLKECLAASKYFAPYVFPQLLEKLDSHSINVKKDVLQAITACATAYGPTTMANQSSTLWDSIKFEVLNGTEEDLIEETLSGIKAIASTLSFGLMDVPKVSPLTRYLKAIVTECLDLLREPTHKQAKPGGSILAACASASPVAHAYILQAVMPSLLVLYDDLDGIAKQRGLLQAISPLFDATLTVYGRWGDMGNPPELSNSLHAFKDRLFDLLSRALMGSAKEEVSFRTVALESLTKLSTIRQFLENNEIGMVVQFLDEIVLKDNSDELRDTALKSLLELSTLKPQLIMDITFPAFMAELPDEDDEDSSKADRKPYSSTLHALAQLSIERSVFEVLLTRLLNKLNVVLNSKSGPSYPHAILSTLLFVLQKKMETNPEEIPSHYKRIVPTILTHTIVPLCNYSEGNAMNHYAVAEVTGKLVNIIMRSMNEKEQQTVVQQFFNLFVLQQPSDLILYENEVVEKNFAPFKPNGIPSFTTTVTIFTHLVAGTRREIPFPIPSVQTFLDSTILLAQFPGSTSHKTALLRLIALIVNKYATKADKEFLATLTDSLWASLQNPTITPETALNLPSLFYITKSLLLKTDPLGEVLLGRLIDLLNHPTLGAVTARGFKVLLPSSSSEDDDLLTKENFCIIRLLAKQRIFAYTHPRLVSGFRSAETSPTSKPNYLIALSHLLQNTPSSLILAEIPTLLPLLLQTLDLSSGADVKSATIQTLYITILDAPPKVVGEYVSSLVTRLLAATTDTSVKVRLSALRCLAVFPTALKTEVLLPYKRQVMKLLQVPLDDGRRVVRREAVGCRARWFTLDDVKDD